MSKRFAVIALASALVALPGCFQDIESPLDADTRQAVLDCQTSIKQLSGRFVRAKMRALQRCADAGLAVQLNEDSGVHPRRLATLEGRMERTCLDSQARVNRASTEYIDGVIEACESVEETILSAPDPLALLQLQRYFVDPEAAFADPNDPSIDISPFDTVEATAGLLCGIHEYLVDTMLVFQAPRGSGYAIAASIGYFSSENEGPEDFRCFEFAEGVVFQMPEILRAVADRL